MMDAQTFLDNYLSHEYDPVKAREYYLRTRKLKGRKPGKGREVAKDIAPAKSDPLKLKGGSPTKTAVKKPVATKDTAARVAALKGRLDRLKQVLSDMQAQVEAAKARSGIETDSEKKAKDKKADAPAEKKSAADKAKDAKAAKKRYEENKDPETSQGAKAVQAEIEAVQKKIADAREALAEALQKARAASQTKPTADVKPSKPSKEGDRQNGT